MSWLEQLKPKKKVHLWKHTCAVCVWDVLSLSVAELGLSQNKGIFLMCLVTRISILKRADDAKTSAISELSGTEARDEKPPKTHFPTFILTHIPQPPHRSSSASHQMTSKCIMGCQKTSKREMGASRQSTTHLRTGLHTHLSSSICSFYLFFTNLKQIFEVDIMKRKICEGKEK